MDKRRDGARRGSAEGSFRDFREKGTSIREGQQSDMCFSHDASGRRAELQLARANGPGRGAPHVAAARVRQRREAPEGQLCAGAASGCDSGAWTAAAAAADRAAAQGSKDRRQDSRFPPLFFTLPLPCSRRGRNGQRFHHQVPQVHQAPRLKRGRAACRAGPHISRTPAPHPLHILQPSHASPPPHTTARPSMAPTIKP